MISFGTKTKLPVAYMWYTAVQATFAGLIIGGVLGLFSSDTTTGVIVGLVFFIPAILLAVVNYVFTSFVAADQEITINAGMIFRTSKTINYGRVQNVDVVRGPIQMMFGLATINIWTASQGQVQSTTSWNNGVSSTQMKATAEGKLTLLKQDADDLRAHISSKGAVQLVAPVSPVPTPTT